MKTGTQGTFVLAWSQTQLNGENNPGFHLLEIGAEWRWFGEAVSSGHVDGFGADDAQDLRTRAARHVCDLVQRSLGDRWKADEAIDIGTFFTLTDGTRSYTATRILTGSSHQPLVMFIDQLPPQGQKLWVVYAPQPPQVETHPMQTVICFTPGTVIATPRGNRPVTELCEGDYVLTRDAGPQQIQWIGQRRLTGARLHAMPELRPIRFRAGSLGIERPEQELLVSPNHRMLVANRAVSANFNTAEVLVSARDLVNGSTIFVEDGLREVQYIHLLLEQHHIIWANGTECESYQPVESALDGISNPDRLRLKAVLSECQTFGPLARRALNTVEAAVLRSQAA